MNTSGQIVDVVVRGGGVAGLWTLHALRRAGFAAALVTRGRLGAGQTIASQGIIHGGIKYALTGTASAASRAIAAMPEVWAACPKGQGDVDLRGVEVLSPRQYLWTSGSLGSKLVGIAASKAIRTAVRRADPSECPAGLRGAGKGVDVYVVEEAVLDPHSLVRELARGMPIVEESHAGRREPGVRGKVIVWCAGAGNPAAITQRRPLHMVMVRGNEERLPMIYGHCVGGSVSGADKPRVTITSQRDQRGRVVWYVGGLVAETGVPRPREEQIEHAKRELGACVGWVNLDGAAWATLRVDRAERASPGGARPDVPVVERLGADEIVAWPTKLAFAPMLASLVIEEVRRIGVQSLQGGGQGGGAGSPGASATVAKLPWDEDDLTWS